ncbi:MAG: septal ring lytic transglycosylase RlpA family protein [Acidobacteriaceae bacterium]
MRVSFALLLVSALVFAGCGRRHVARRQLPPPPMPQQGTATSSNTERGKVPPAKSSQPAETEQDAEKNYRGVKPIYTETGIASWYGTVYHHRRAANGEIYDQNGLTAAHKTLPLNSTVRVTNLSNDKSVLVRITDRGPFVGDRVIDLSLGAAKIIGLYLPGTARVRVDVLESPKDIASGGRWCVQIGAFDSYEKAAQLKEKLLQRYRTAKVLQFTGPTGEWLRVRVFEDNKQRAYEVAKETRAPEGVFVVRLD